MQYTYQIGEYNFLILFKNLQLMCYVYMVVMTIYNLFLYCYYVKIAFFLLTYTNFNTIII